MTKNEWISEAKDQIKYHESIIKCLTNCGPDECENNKFFKTKDIIKTTKKQISFLKEGIGLLENE